MLNATKDFEKLLNGRDQGTLKYYNLVLLSDFITAICDPQKQTEDNLVRHSLHIFLYNIKQLRDEVYSASHQSSLIHIITRTAFFQQFILLLIIHIFLPKAYFTSARKYIPEGVFLYGMYVLYNLKRFGLPAYLAYKKYTAEYDRLTSTWALLSDQIVKDQDKTLSTFIDALT